MLQHSVRIKSVIYKHVQKRNEETTILLKKATSDNVKAMQLTIFCKSQSISSELFEAASRRFIDYWSRFFPNFVLHDVYYEVNEAEGFTLTANFKRGQRRIKGETSSLKEKTSELLKACLKEVTNSVVESLDEELKDRQKQLDEQKSEFKKYRAASKEEIEKKDKHLNHLQEKYKKMDESLSVYQEQVDEMEKERDPFFHEVESKNDELAIREARYEELTKEVTLRQQRLDKEYEKFKKQVERDVQNKDERLSSLQDRYAQLETEVISYEKKIKKIEAEHQVSHDKIEEDIGEKARELTDLQKQLEEKQELLVETLIKFEEDKQQAEIKLQEKESELSSWEKKVAEITKELMEWHQEEHNLDILQEVVVNEFSKQEQELAALDNKRTELITKLVDCQEQIRKTEQEQQKQLKQTEQLTQQKSEQLDKLTATHDQVVQINQMAVKAEKYTEEVTKLEGELADYQQQLEITPLPAEVEDAQELKRFSEVKIYDDFRHMGEQEKGQSKPSPKIEKIREQLKASVKEQGMSAEQVNAEPKNRLAVVTSGDKPMSNQKNQLEKEIRELFKQAESSKHEKRVKVAKDDYYTYITTIDFLDYQWSQAVLQKPEMQKDDFFIWGQTYIDQLPSFKDDLELNVRKQLFNKASYLTTVETLNRLKAYTLLNQYLEL